ncbi:hypothetical protein GCM10017673_34340 [Streptosporangium violaceochromogenes]|nr:hypothetical protein GCM10017673_34340 [Streptosporangium violaceochromogenes]
MGFGDGEASQKAGRGVGPKREELDGDPRGGADVEKMGELCRHYGGAADRAVKNSFVEDCPEHGGLRAAKDRLTFHPGGYVLLNFFGRYAGFTVEYGVTSTEVVYEFSLVTGVAS